jgi:hypothetical protein
MARTRQAPLRSGYGPKTTAREVIGDRRLDGMVAVVTGGWPGACGHPGFAGGIQTPAGGGLTRIWP